MVRIERLFKIFTALITILSIVIIPLLLVTLFVGLKYGGLQTGPLIDLGLKGFELLCGVNFMIAFVILVWQLRLERKRYLIISTFLVVFATLLTQVHALFYLVAWVMYLIAFILLIRFKN